MNKTKILLVGCGKMGMALLKGWIAGGIVPGNIFVVDPNADSAALAKVGVNARKDNSGLPDDFDFCLFAVKPQNFDEVVGGYKKLANNKCIFISIAAGKTIATMEKLLGGSTKVIRAMPNLPATVSSGITAVFAPTINSSERVQIHQLFESVGDVVDIHDESQIDIITAISGSGPAYVFYIIEVLTWIGIEAGLEQDVALALARSTVFGAGKLAIDNDPKTLREAVTSKGGTTEAALKVLMEGGKLEKLLQTAIKAAIARAKELQ